MCPVPVVSGVLWGMKGVGIPIGMSKTFLNISTTLSSYSAELDVAGGNQSVAPVDTILYLFPVVKRSVKS